MELRVAKKGPKAGNEFWGCVDFPDCRGTVDRGSGGQASVASVARIISSGTRGSPPSGWKAVSLSRPRGQPYVWMTWLAKAMSGDVSCVWQPWFRAHYQLAATMPEGTGLDEWRAKHTRLVQDLAGDLQHHGYDITTEYSLRLEFDNGTILAGKADCLAQDEENVIVYECKTGRRRAGDELQLMTYLYALGFDPLVNGRALSAVLVYEDEEIEVAGLPDGFEENVGRFISTLGGMAVPVKSPGSDCKFCPITREDCWERVE